VVLAEKGGVSAVATRETYPRVATLPFDAAYKMMATFHRMTDDSGKEVIRCFVKGAPDQLLARAGDHITPDLSHTSPVDDGFRQRYLDENERLGAKGLRVMATGRKDFDPASFDPSADLLTLLDGLTLLALVGIVDPPRPAAKASIATAHSAGIQVRMITGDHAVTAQAIAHELGIRGRAITGAEFRAMTDEQALRELDDIGVIARVTPEDKVHLVDLLRKKGHIVAMTGDGVNDAPALKKADIGVAMGITGTEVSKEAAVMILTDDDFSTIVKAVDLGRGLYDNLKKYIRFQVGLLIGYIFTFLGSSIMNILGGVPFVPVQTLFMNFTIQVFQAVGLGYGKPAVGLMERKPRPSNEALLGRRLLVWLFVAGGVMGLSTLAVLVWANQTYDDESIARTMAMVTFSISNVAFSFATKDERRSAFSLDVLGDRPFLIATAVSIATIILMTELRFLQRLLGTSSLELDQWAICLVVGLIVIVVAELRKLLIPVQLEEEPAKAEIAVSATPAA
jgi:Ca2+-transporting ATPase